MPSDQRHALVTGGSRGIGAAIADLATRIEHGELSGCESDGVTVRVGVRDLAILIGCRGRGLGHLYVFRLARALVISKEEEPVLLDGPAERAAEDVADELSGDVW